MKRKHKLTFSTRIILIVSAFLLVMDGVLGSVMMIRSITKMKEIITGKIMETAQTAAAMLDGDEIISLTHEDHDNKTEKFMHSYNTLLAFKTHTIDDNAGLAYIYCVVQDDEGRLVFSVDPSGVDDPEEEGGFLVEETIDTPAIRHAFAGKADFDDVSYVDRWGDLLSAYAPIFGRTEETKDKVQAVVGVDVWASWYKNEITSNAIMIGVVTIVTIGLGVVAAFFITRKMRKRLDVLSTEMEELQEDIKSLISDIHDPKYISDAEPADYDGGKGLTQLRQQINATKTAVKDYIEYAHQQAYVDALTGLGNRNAYFVVVEDLNKKISGKEYVNFAVLVFDINGLKQINDIHGHEAGDTAIIISGDCLKTVFGLENSFRIGGDELVVIYQSVYEDTVKEKMMEVDKLLVEEAKKRNISFELSVSHGYAFFDEKTDKRYREVFKKADERMYEQKSAYYKKSNKNRRHL